MLINHLFDVSFLSFAPKAHNIHPVSMNLHGLELQIIIQHHYNFIYTIHECQEIRVTSNLFVLKIRP